MSTVQDGEVGDDTMSVTVLDIELLCEAEKLVLRLRGAGNLGCLEDSFLDEGFLLDKKVGQHQPKCVENARKLIANTPMDTDKIKVPGSHIKVDSMAKVAELELAEKEKTKDKVAKIFAHDCNMFINRFTFVIKTTGLLFRLKDCLKLYHGQENILSIAHCNIISKVIDIIVSLGFMPCLNQDLRKLLQGNNTEDYTQFTSPITKYEELIFNVKSFMELTKEPTLKGLIMTKHTNVLLAGLCQLGLLPIAKPGSKIATELAIDDLKYKQLMNEQEKFKYILKRLVLFDRDPFVLREIIFIIGDQNCSKHMKRGLGDMLSDLLIQSNGIQTILKVICDLTTETSQNFFQDVLQNWANLIHNFYINSKTKYTQYIIPQLWILLRTNTKFYQKQFQSIAVFCIHLMSLESHSSLLEYFMIPVEESLKMSNLQKNQNTSVSQCIEDVHTLFYLFKNEYWSLNPKLLTHIAAVIYNVYIATARGVFYLKSKLEDLVFLILSNFSDDKDHLKLIIFSQYQIDVKYDDDGGNIQINYMKRQHQFDLESQVDIILNLMDNRADSTMMTTMFIVLLDMFIDVPSNEYSLMEKLFIIKAIHHLIEKDIVQKSICTSPENVLNLIKSILKENIKNNKIEIEVLSILLMVLGCLLENIDEKYINNLDFFMEYLPKIAEIVEHGVLKDMVLEMEQKIKQMQNVCLNKPVGVQRTIDDVLFDARDPLLPCRSHALIELKKMIESGDKMVLAKKSAILIVIQENLKNSDSYLYLSAIFTLSTLCSYYPDDIIPILCEEFSMPKNYNHSPETRLKIGEVLMKTIRSLNEIIPSYKNRLLNTFMAGVRDDDHLVRTSSLSNLADVCRLLRYNLGSIVAEIVNCADYVLRYDKAVEPRRAAVLLLQMLIQGGDSELLEILGSSLKDIYQMLKFQYQCDKDETINLHAQVAIERLNDVMKSLFINENN